jgi:glutathione S-transferase
MRVLYLFPMSVFSRRARLVLAHKGLDAELRDGRSDSSHLAEARRLFPLRTMPVLVDEGRVVGDSTSMAHYLDLVYPERPLWPKAAAAAADAMAVTTAIDLAMNTIVDLGTRSYELRNDPAWAEISREKMERAQGAMEFVAAKATRPILAGDSWGAAEIWAYAATKWVLEFPKRAPTNANIAQMVTLGLRVPPELASWAEQHEGRPDVRAVYAV